MAAPPRLIKKLTVIGMIGHTHGVKIANKPPSKPITNIHQMEDPSISPSRGVSLVFAKFSPSEGELERVHSHVSGAVHILSSQAL